MQRLILIVFIICIGNNILAQKSQKERKHNDIYVAAIAYSFNFPEIKKPLHFILIDSIRNKEITTADYSLFKKKEWHFSESFRKDSLWWNFLTDFSKMNKSLENGKLPSINSTDSIGIRMLSKYEMSTQLNPASGIWYEFQRVYSWADGYMELSDIIMSNTGNKAILELNYHQDSQSGYGQILFLEMNESNCWFVVASFGTWMS